MDFNNVLTIVVKIFAAITVGFISYIMPKVVAWIKMKVGEEETGKLLYLIQTYVEAAEQLYKDDDKDGSKRKAYVEALLVELGYELTAEVNAYIEAEVFKLNQQTE